MGLQSTYEISKLIRSYPRGFPQDLAIEIRYRDERGSITDRTIWPRKYSKAYDGREFIKAWCGLRNSERTFRVDRIVWASLSNDAPIVVARLPTVYHARRQPTARAVVARPAANPVVAPRQTPSRPATPAKKSHHYLLKVVCIGAAVLLLRVFFTERGTDSYGTPSRAHAVSARMGISERSLSVSATTTRTTLANTLTRTVYENTLASNSSRFTETTGITNQTLLARYADADKNCDAALSWSEIASFQRSLKQDFAYISNDVALRPDNFLVSGGGDCEDWSLVTAGLLRFWGYQTYIGSMRSSDNINRHAVCLVRLAEKPSGYFYYHFEESGTFGGSYISSGYYVPIDYENVGSLTSAVGPGWELRHIYTPEKIYGMAM